MTLIQSWIHFGAQKKFIQYVIILHILMHGRPVQEYESLQELFLLLKVKSMPLKHWSNNNHSYDILGARMLWKPKEARILKKFKKIYRSTSVIW
jgi:hypothetical protein